MLAKSSPTETPAVKSASEIYACEIRHNGCKGYALATVWMNLYTQNSGPEQITCFTKTTEESRDDTLCVK